MLNFFLGFIAGILFIIYLAYIGIGWVISILREELNKMEEKTIEKRIYITKDGFKHWTKLTQVDCEYLKLDYEKVRELQHLAKKD